MWGLLQSSNLESEPRGTCGGWRGHSQLVPNLGHSHLLAASRPLEASCSPAADFRHTSEPSQDQKNHPDEAKLLIYRIIIYINGDCFKPLILGLLLSKANWYLFLWIFEVRFPMCPFFFLKYERKKIRRCLCSTKFFPTKVSCLVQQNSGRGKGYLHFKALRLIAFLFYCAEANAWLSLYFSFLYNWSFIVF